MNERTPVLRRCSCPEHDGPNPVSVHEFSRSGPNGKKLHCWCKPCRARAARISRASAGKKPKPGKPCLVCGEPTTAPVQVCQRTRACAREYKRLEYQRDSQPFLARTKRWRQKQPRPGKLARFPLRPPPLAKPCTSCGQPTASALGICSAPSCINEHRRLERTAQRQDDKPSVYAVWFPASRVLKVGFTAHKTDSLFVSTARTKAKRRGWNIESAGCIWKRPGDLRTEAWMQSTLAFRWHPAFEQKQSRICEWFEVPLMSDGQLMEVLDEIYGLVPVDLAGAA